MNGAHELTKCMYMLSSVCLERVRTLHSQNPQNSQLTAMRPSLLRSVFTVGLICKQFDMNTISPQSTQVGT